jgi:hypothetical protein
MRRVIAAIAVLMLSGCAAEREAERAAPDVSFQGPLRPVTLSSAQIALVQKGVTGGLVDMKDTSTPSFGDSYRAARSSYGDVAVCGFVNGKRFVGLLTKPEGGATLFLPIKIAVTEEEQGDAKLYCRVDGIYLPG